MTVCAKWHHDAMRTTIDQEGRVIIPAAIMERAGLSPGSELEVTQDEFGIRLERVAAGPTLIKVGRRLVARPTAPPNNRPTVDFAALIEEERRRRP
jgi:AbrB family looped-hinge helix DNA binding protein